MRKIIDKLKRRHHKAGADGNAGNRDGSSQKVFHKLLLFLNLIRSYPAEGLVSTMAEGGF